MINDNMFSYNKLKNNLDPYTFAIIKNACVLFNKIKEYKIPVTSGYQNEYCTLSEDTFNYIYQCEENEIDVIKGISLLISLLITPNKIKPSQKYFNNFIQSLDTAERDIVNSALKFCRLDPLSISYFVTETNSEVKDVYDLVKEPVDNLEEYFNENYKNYLESLSVIERNNQFLLMDLNPSYLLFRLIYGVDYNKPGEADFNIYQVILFDCFNKDNDKYFDITALYNQEVSRTIAKIRNNATTSSINNYKNLFIERMNSEQANELETYFAEEELKVLQNYGEFFDGAKVRATPVLYRQDIINKLQKVFLNPTNLSAILVGKAGVGKTAIMEEFARLIKTDKEKINKNFRNVLIFDFDLNAFMSETSYVGQAEEKFSKFINIIKNHPNILVYIDEIHTIVGAGRSKDSANDLTNMLKRHISSGAIKIIGATTDEEYKRHFSSEGNEKTQNAGKAFNDRFSKIEVRPLEIPEIQEIAKTSIEAFMKSGKYPLQLDMSNLQFDSLCKFLAVLTNEYSLETAAANPRNITQLVGNAIAEAKFRDDGLLKIEDFVNAIRDSGNFDGSKTKFIINKLNAILANVDLTMSEDWPSKIKNELSEAKPAEKRIGFSAY